MKGVFGMLLIGGGIILMVGLFTGKIFSPAVQTTAPSGKNTQPGTVSTKGTQCPPGYVFVPIAGGTTGTCVKA